MRRRPQPSGTAAHCPCGRRRRRLRRPPRRPRPRRAAGVDEPGSYALAPVLPAAAPVPPAPAPTVAQEPPTGADNVTDVAVNGPVDEAGAGAEPDAAARGPPLKTLAHSPTARSLAEAAVVDEYVVVA